MGCKQCPRKLQRIFRGIVIISNILLILYIIKLLSGISLSRFKLTYEPQRIAMENDKPERILKKSSEKSTISKPLSRPNLQPPMMLEEPSETSIITSPFSAPNIQHPKIISVEKTMANQRQVAMTWTSEIRDKLTIIKNYIRATGKPPGYNSSVTLTTQGTYEYLGNIQTVCQRWDGPISLAVYAPDTDLEVAIRKIIYMRQCGPPCVSTNITWHIIYDVGMGPKPSELKEPNVVGKLHMYEPIICSKGFTRLRLVSLARERRKLPYPINTARNVARVLAKTRYVFASDIELNPSENIVARFMQMVANNATVHKLKRVYPLPVFEIQLNVPIPRTKFELIESFRRNESVFFHKYVCDHCHAFPRRDEWVEFVSENDSLSVFHVTKRIKPYHRWEPFFISTNTIPLYDERFSWNGKVNKMSQAYELCALEYDFCILDNAFLVHAPGIKTLKIARSELAYRASYMRENTEIYKIFLQEVKSKYGFKKNC